MNVAFGMNENDLINAIERAAYLWKAHTNLTIKRAHKDKSADIEILFASGYHNDKKSFDGPGFVLAHAFYPPLQSSNYTSALSGDVHLGILKYAYDKLII